MRESMNFALGCVASREDEFTPLTFSEFERLQRHLAVGLAVHQTQSELLHVLL